MLLPASQNRCKAPGHTVVKILPIPAVSPFFCICPRGAVQRPDYQLIFHALHRDSAFGSRERGFPASGPEHCGRVESRREANGLNSGA